MTREPGTLGMMMEAIMEVWEAVKKRYEYWWANEL